VPHHAAQQYVARLLAAGFKVALCDQTEDASLAKGLVARAVVRVVTPGTVTEEAYLDPREPNYLIAVARDGEGFGVIAADVSTGEMRQALADGAAAFGELLGRWAPRECVFPAGDMELMATLRAAAPAAMLSPLAAERFDAAAGLAWLAAHHSTASAPAAAALGALLGYLAATHRAGVDHLRAPEQDAANAVLVIDEASRRNLELLTTTRGERRGSLLSVLDETSTPMGGRLLRHWLLAPLTDLAAIGARLDAVETMVRQPSRRGALTERLARIGDLERLTARLAAARVGPRDLLGLGAALAAVGVVRDGLAGLDAAALRAAAQQLDPLPQVQARIAATISDDVPLKPRPGQLLKPGCDAEADELRQLALHGKQFFGEYEARERQRTGIASLKVRYNSVFGYYLEVTKPNLHLVPPEYRRKQTVATGERFVTPELEQYEAKVLGAEERLGALEARRCAALVSEIATEHTALSRSAAALARVDVFSALALVAERQRYVRPVVGRDRRLVIEEGRHPVVEAMAGRDGFVANDCRLDPDGEQILVLTGPNMAGKSTYLRQVALIALLAQMGSFVPAARAEIGIVDRLFTRVGASDNLAGGESTFMVEMKETAHILTQLTPRSLAVLDEIGRGTSTFDGISIAWAVAEHLHDAPERPLVLFATHYHELTDLARSKPRVRNWSVAVREWQGDVVFLRRIIAGPASQSYGIQVAKLAGVPAPIIARARAILANLERDELTAAGEARLAASGEKAAGGAQLGLFAPPDDRLRSDLATLDVDALTPLEALNRLHELVQRARKAAG
jgi:DNA mismatch repair protein MutS